MRPGRVEGDHPVADRASLHVRGDLADGAGAQIADDVRDRGQIPRRAGEQIAALDADRLGVNDHAAVRALGIGHILVAKHLRRAVLVDNRCLHLRQSSRLERRAVIGRAGHQL